MLENYIRTTAFYDELEKIAKDRVNIPKGGLKSGLLMNDITQVMTDEDARKVRDGLPFYKRSGPGLLPMSAIAAMSGASFGYSLGTPIKKSLIRYAVPAAVILPLLGYILTKSGKYDKQALSAATDILTKMASISNPNQLLKKKTISYYTSRPTKQIIDPNTKQAVTVSDGRGIRTDKPPITTLIEKYFSRIKRGQ